jgi:cysteine desulfurase
MAEEKEEARRQIFKSSQPIYLDYNATTPIAPEVVAAMEPYFTTIFGNPSSSHSYGVSAKKAIERSREKVVTLLNRADPREVIFTSGGTESANWVIRSVCRSASKRSMMEGGPRHSIVISAVEHPAIRRAAQFCAETFDTRVIVVPVDSVCRVQPAALQSKLALDTVLVCVMHSNNEVGTMNEVNELVRVTKKSSRDILFLCDTTQSIGKVSLEALDQLTNGVSSKSSRRTVKRRDSSKSGEDASSSSSKEEEKALKDITAVDFLIIGGHKLYAPKGIGALWINPTTRSRLTPFLYGGSQEYGLRSGTENTPYCVALGTACDLVRKELKENGISHLERYKILSDKFVNRLMRSLPHFHHKRVRLNGHASMRLPNTLSISFANLRGDHLAERLSSKFVCSTGSACHSGDVSASPVLTAMDVDPVFSLGTIRVSVGRYTTTREVMIAARILAAEVIAMYEEIKMRADSKL